MKYSKIKSVLGTIRPEHTEERKYFDQHRYRYADTLAKIPANLIADKNVADLGAIPGHLTQMLKLLGAQNVTGIDYNPERFGFKQAFASRGIQLLQRDLNKDALPFADESLDTILFTEVIEHLTSPQHAIEEIRRVLKPGGAVVVTTPNIKNLANRLRKLVHQPIYPSSEALGKLPQQQHVHEYAMSELVNHFSNLNFEIISKSYIAGTEKAILHNTMPRQHSRLASWLYALIPLAIPPLRSYLFISIKKV